MGFLLNKRTTPALIGYSQINSRIIVAEVQTKTLNITVAQVYGQMSSRLEEEINQFYNNLESTLSLIPKEELKVIMKDWNTQLGGKNTCSEEVMGRCGYGDKNERGELLFEFHAKYNLCITNIHFQQKYSRKWTWLAHGCQYHHMIDLILIEKH